MLESCEALIKYSPTETSPPILVGIDNLGFPAKIKSVSPSKIFFHITLPVLPILFQFILESCEALIKYSATETSPPILVEIDNLGFPAKIKSVSPSKIFFHITLLFLRVFILGDAGEP